MAKSQARYSAEFREQMVELVRAGRSPHELAEEFEPSAQTIRNWFLQAERDAGNRSDGLNSEEQAELCRLRQENRQLREEREILGKAGGLVRSGIQDGSTRIFRFVRANQAMHSVATMCRVLGVSRSGFYAWRRRQPSARERADRALLGQIRAIHGRSRGTYGAPRIHAELAEAGFPVSRKRVARLMRQDSLRGVTRRKGIRTTTPAQQERPAPDWVDRAFQAEAPDALWVSDITYMPTDAGFLYLAMVLDVFSRRVVGWSMAGHMRTELVLNALDMAVHSRKPESVIHHSDQGCQYTSLAFGQRCQEAGIAQSMGSVGDCYDNALAESFFATLECELIDRQRFRNHPAAKRAIFEFIEGWYNPTRRHSALGQRSPRDHEQAWQEAA
ncbi:IS3 family transposase [Thiohalorhabdus methylotrophus]|uniref:IS3 family transposase n=1 Tax=Thiohalorhabdus methylotrophus TaxID=3242694 RepID=A0ABV4TZ97_9GAMM